MFHSQGALDTTVLAEFKNFLGALLTYIVVVFAPKVEGKTASKVGKWGHRSTYTPKTTDNVPKGPSTDIMRSLDFYIGNDWTLWVCSTCEASSRYEFLREGRGQC